ncbi:type II toxin-antitoxin system HicB family antitoxin [Mesorhizobium sp. B2-5-3]|uniref:type II toxin-antitoxin system HicB family antitoxin n=1 Tax=Mesorhizobium sp. B2-5-3 TaxID=2589927 RepID=UPI00112AEE38|nr:type II toxin-antitoxin system HicB family antitoxin [Mesorhizobium sp. B2-5-3]TPK38728.1 type II toxin-antitoxin system HicB family antitoxin [Mesorhizobium sp. B2-5-3]
MESEKYPAQVFWSDEDEGYIAIAPDLPGCSAFGESQQEALSELAHAIEAWADAARAAGNDVPRPSKPAVKAKFSGKTLLRMPTDLHARLALRANEEGVSLNQYAVYLLATALATNSKRARQHHDIYVHLNNYVVNAPVPAVRILGVGPTLNPLSWPHHRSPEWLSTDHSNPILSTSSSVPGRTNQIA